MKTQEQAGGTGMSDHDVVEAFQFIMAEFVRHARMSWDELKECIKDEWLCDLHDRAGRRRTVGRAAFDALSRLSDDALATSTWHRRLDPDRAFKAVTKGFGHDFIHPDFKEPSAKGIRRALRRWLAKAAKDCEARTHFIPCHLGLDAQEEFVLGPVTFRRREAQMDALSEPFAAFAAKGNVPGGRQMSLDAVATYFRTFPEVGVVRVPGCDAPTSERLAAETIQAAVDYVHLMGGASYTDRVRSGGPALEADRRARLTVADDGEVEISWSIGFEGGRLGDGFWKWLKQDVHQGIHQGVGVALSTVADAREPEMLAARFLDGCRWYADAAREPSPAAAAVKYLTGMERLLWTTDKKGSTRRIAERAAALCFSTETWNLRELTDEVERAYGIRSAVVHGRISRDDPKIRRHLRLCETVARGLLIQWVTRFWDGFDREVSVQKLHDYLEAFVASAKKDAATALEQAAIVELEARPS